MDIQDKKWCLDKAIEIVKERARGGDKFSTTNELSEVYKKLKELYQDI